MSFCMHVWIVHYVYVMLLPHPVSSCERVCVSWVGLIFLFAHLHRYSAGTSMPDVWCNLPAKCGLGGVNIVMCGLGGVNIVICAKSACCLDVCLHFEIHLLWLVMLAVDYVLFSSIHC